MNKYLVFSFLISFTLFSFFYGAQAMEESTKEELIPHSVTAQQREYVVSLEEGTKALSNSALRTQHPIDNVIHFGNLDRMLYKSSRDSDSLIYNDSFDQIKMAIEKLKLIAHKSSGCRLLCEESALAHIFLVATNLLDGTNGMIRDRRFGAELMEWYVNEITQKIPNEYTQYVKKFFKVDYFLDNFIEDCQRERRIFCERHFGKLNEHNANLLTGDLKILRSGFLY